MTRMIAGIPEAELEAYREKVEKIQLAAYQLALDVERMSESDRKFTGFKDAGHVLKDAARDIEKLIVALEKKYPS